MFVAVGSVVAVASASRRRTLPRCIRGLAHRRALHTSATSSNRVVLVCERAPALARANFRERGVARRAGASTVAPPTVASYEVGKQLHGWTCKRAERIEEFGCSGYLFEHDRTGAELISMVQPADENKTFGVVFRTPPENSNGIAHVLEHSVLCGSRKYPLKEPFVELLKSSVQTFLNAMTFPDRTCYPVASCNLQDFYNLIDVYMDAVLHPRAVHDPLVLAQEGWHYEVENLEDPFVYKGVVFNEMKGVYSDPDTSHSRLANQSLFPDNAYAVDSGGDPQVIPTLDFDYFRRFHEKYYHPSNAKFWFYGDDPADKRLELLDAFLSDFEKISVDSTVKQQPLFREPKRVVGEFVVGQDEDISKRAMVTVNWVIGEGKPDLQTNLALSFLNYLLVGTPAAPLYKALVDSGFGSSIIGGGLYDGILQPTFSIGLKDLKEEDTDAVEKLILDTLDDIAKVGFEQDAIKAAINTIEFRNRELNTGSFPKGLALMFAAVDNWNYGKDPFEPLRFNRPLDDLKQRLADGETVFETLIREKLLLNPHKVVVQSRPNKELGKALEEAERSKLAEFRKTLDPDAIRKLMEETKMLKLLQETPDPPEATEKVPRLEIADIPKATPKIPTDVFTPSASGPTTLVHPLPTSGVVYADIAFSLADVPEDLLPLLPMFTASLKQLGTSKGDFVSLTRRIGISTGGISASTTCMSRIGSPKAAAYLIVRGKSMGSQVPNLVDLIQEIVLEVDLGNKDRFVQLLRQSKSGAESQLLSSGHVVASRRLGAQTTQAGWVTEQLSGLSQYQFLSRTLAQIDAGGWEEISHKLKVLQAAIFNKSACSVLNITADPSNVEAGRFALETFAAGLPSSPFALDSETRPAWNSRVGRTMEGIIVPTQVNYVGKGGNLYAHGYKLHGSSLVISKFLGTTYLWDRVRVSGGAYGGFCQFDHRSGDFKYLSYRDPNIEQTWKTYDGASAFLRGLELHEDELTKAIIGCIGDVDAYMLPDAKGHQAMLRHLLGEGDEARQQLRDEILSTSAADFKNFAVGLDTISRTGSLCVVGSKEAVEAVGRTYELTLTSPFASAALEAESE